VTDVEKDESLRMRDTVNKIIELMTEQRTARTCMSMSMCSSMSVYKELSTHPTGGCSPLKRFLTTPL